jgi:NTP pyrophosphatase (non-canonical NTP hydrolase)
MTDLEKLQQAIQQFSLDRDWDQFHSPKNLSMALNVEAGELLECFQWLSEKQSKDLNDEQISEVSDELADVFIYLIRLAEKLNINLIEVANNKIKKNGEKYPVEKSKGNSIKYDKL